MIPKKIHYCWFGRGEKPALAKKCIDSWRKYHPDYEIIEWNEDNFDVNTIAYTAEAYEAKKYAFVSDYARFKILYEHGGLYFDTDVEILRPLDDIIAAGPFMGCQGKFRSGATPNELGVAPGLGLGVNPGLGLYKEILDYYKDLHFKKEDGSLDTTTIVVITTGILIKNGLKNVGTIQDVCGIRIYPNDYFNPKDYKTGKIMITPNTYTIHHFAESWVSNKEKFLGWLRRNFGDWTLEFLLSIKNWIKA